MFLSLPFSSFMFTLCFHFLPAVVIAFVRAGFVPSPGSSTPFVIHCCGRVFASLSSACFLPPPCAPRVSFSIIIKTKPIILLEMEQCPRNLATSLQPPRNLLATSSCTLTSSFSFSSTSYPSSCHEKRWFKTSLPGGQRPYARTKTNMLGGGLQE
jgi:hypothetical protein